MTHVLIFEDAFGERYRREVGADDDLRFAVIRFIEGLPPLRDGDAIRIEEIPA